MNIYEVGAPALFYAHFLETFVAGKEVFPANTDAQ
jgi:hypothetical protein